MEPNTLFDLHCDTLTTYLDTPRSLSAPTAHFSLKKLPRGVNCAQCTAIFLPDGTAPEERLLRYERCLRALRAQAGENLAVCASAEEIEFAWGNRKAAAVLTIENGSLLCGKLARAEELAEDGVRMLTLTWNGQNEIGSGHTSHDGLTPFGTALIPELERLGIIVDVSHLNDEGFRDLLHVAKVPFAASHSNSRAVCAHNRNLTDDQLRAMADRGCLIGLTFFSPFLRDDDQPATREDLLRHLEHMMDLVGEHGLALGSDFDGADLPPQLDSPEDTCAFGRFLLDRGYGTELVEDLLWRNALAFWRAVPPLRGEDSALSLRQNE